MTLRLLVSIFIVITMYGCASTTSTNQNSSVNAEKDPLEKMREISLNIVRVYASGTKPFFEEYGEQETIALAQNNVKEMLKDPNSAKFQNMRIVDYEGGKVVCGEVNAKNSYGGYVGYESFVAGLSGATMFETSKDDPAVNDAINTGINDACGN